MSDVSEAVTAIMATEIVDIRGGMANTLKPSYDSFREEYHAAGSSRRTNKADVARDVSRRRLPTGGRPSSVHITRTVSDTSTATSATVVAGSRSASVSSELLTSKYASASGVENDADILIGKLRAAEAERDTALVELTRVRRQVAHSLALPNTNADAGKNSMSLDDEGETEDWAFAHQISSPAPSGNGQRSYEFVDLQLSKDPKIAKSYSVLRQTPCAAHPSSASVIREPSPFPRDVSSTLSPAALEQMRFDILATLPVPAYYPSEPLRPILMPTKMDLEGFLDHSTGSTKRILRDYRKLFGHEVTWCANRPHHGFIFEPRQVSKPSKAAPYISELNPLQPPPLGKSRRWTENTKSSVMRKRPVEVFMKHGGDWFYVGSFKSYPLPDMTALEFETLEFATKHNLLRDTIEQWPTDSEKTAEMMAELVRLYDGGKLKIACVGFQCVDFNHSLNRIMLEQSRRLKLTRANTN